MPWFKLQQVSSFAFIPQAIGILNINCLFSPGAVLKSRFRLFDLLFILPLSLRKSTALRCIYRTTCPIELSHVGLCTSCISTETERTSSLPRDPHWKTFHEFVAYQVYVLSIYFEGDRGRSGSRDGLDLGGSSGGITGNVPIADPANMDELSTGMELEDLMLDVLLVSLRFDRR